MKKYSIIFLALLSSMPFDIFAMQDIETWNSYLNNIMFQIKRTHEKSSSEYVKKFSENETNYSLLDGHQGVGLGTLNQAPENYNITIENVLVFDRSSPTSATRMNHFRHILRNEAIQRFTQTEYLGKKNTHHAALFLVDTNSKTHALQRKYQYNVEIKHLKRHKNIDTFQEIQKEQTNKMPKEYYNWTRQELVETFKRECLKDDVFNANKTNAFAAIINLLRYTKSFLLSNQLLLIKNSKYTDVIKTAQEIFKKLKDQAEKEEMRNNSSDAESTESESEEDTDEWALNTVKQDVYSRIPIILTVKQARLYTYFKCKN